MQTGAEVTGVEQTDAAVTVTYRTGDDIHRQTADVLIGADGIHSAVRTSVWPHTADPVFQRILVWRGVTAPGSVWPVDGFQTWGRGVRFAAHPISAERVFWFAAIRQPEPHVHYDDDMAEVVERVNATVLAAELAGDADIPAALARYDSLRRPRTQTVQRGARKDPSISLSTNAFVYATMTRLTALAGSRIAARKTAHLWNWTPPSLDGHPVTTGTGR